MIETPVTVCALLSSRSFIYCPAVQRKVRAVEVRAAKDGQEQWVCWWSCPACAGWHVVSGKPAFCRGVCLAKS
ncbi:MAG: hypothetical protein HC875_41435 [Anaerolineales bacterium]|nr:hypothetical protein [Anaerolineales bacterium]